MISLIPSRRDEHRCSHPKNRVLGGPPRRTTQLSMVGQLDWETQYVDDSVIRAHQHAAGTHNSSPDAEALGRSQGGFSTKIHVRAEGGGKPMIFVLTAGPRHEAVAFEQVMEQGTVKRRGRGRARGHPQRIVGDKGSSSGKIRAYLCRRRSCSTIPRKHNKHRTGPFHRAIDRTRNRVERLINRLKQARCIATQYEKCAVYFMAMLTIAAIELWL